MYIQTTSASEIIGNFNCTDLRVSCTCKISGILQSCVNIIEWINLYHWSLSGGYTCCNYKFRSLISELNVNISLRCVYFASFTEYDCFLKELSFILLVVIFDDLALSSVSDTS